MHTHLTAGKGMFQLLKDSGMTSINKGVLRRAEIHFSSRITNTLLQQNPESARDIYHDAENLPSTQTKVSLLVSNIHVNGELIGGEKPVLLCFERFAPRVLKYVELAEKDRLTDIKTDLDHPNIVKFNFVSDKYIIMPHYSSTLEHIESVDGGEGCELWERMQSALAHLHSKELAHMDVKPSNILICSNGSLVLGDLGSVARFGVKSESSRAYVPFDMQIIPCKLIASAEVDWWMLAMTLAEKVTGLEIGGSKKEPSRDKLKDMLSSHKEMETIWPCLHERLYPSDALSQSL